MTWLCVSLSGLSACCSTTLVQNEIFWQLFDGLQWNCHDITGFQTMNHDDMTWTEYFLEDHCKVHICGFEETVSPNIWSLFILNTFYLLCFSSPFPSVVYMVPGHVKDLKVEKFKVRTNRNSSLPQKTLFLKRLIGGPSSNYVNSWHHSASPMSHICLLLPLFHSC